jgi:hypothetical protein
VSRFLFPLLFAFLVSFSQDNHTVVFRIQLGTATKMPDNNSPFRKHFADVEGVMLEDSIIRVYTGKYETYNEAREVLPAVQAKGYKFAYVVAFHKGKRITVDEAMQIIYGD